MAQINEATELPDVEPTTRGIDVHATPEAFGAPIAEGIKSVGAVADQLGTFYDQVAADDATNNWHKKVNTILNGDPNDPDKPGYLNQKGADAMHGYAQMQQDLNDAEQEQRNTLGSARAKFEFDQDTRRTRFLLDQQTSGHYRQQYNEWQIKTNEDKLQGAKDLAANNPDDQNAIGLALTQAREAAIATAQITRGKSFGQNPDDAQKEVDHADQQVRLAQFGAYMVSNPSKALDLLKGDGGKVLRSLPENQYVSLYRQAEEWASNSFTAQKSDASMQDWQGKAAQAVQAPKDQAAIGAYVANVPQQVQPAVQLSLAGESHHDPLSAGPGGDYKYAGLGQFSTDQWKTTTGETIKPEDVGVVGKDPRLDAAKSIAAMGKFAQQNHDQYVKIFGQEPTAGDLALMHQQGTAGGIKLFQALREKPNSPAVNVIGAQALTQNRDVNGSFLPATATVAQAVRGIEGYYTNAAAKGGGGSFGGGGAESQYPSQSDYMLEHRQEAVEQFRASIADNPVFGGRSDLIDKAVFSFENRYNRTITDQSHEYQVGARQTLTMIHTNGYTSDNEVLASGQQNAAMLMNTLAINPNFRLALDSMYKANSSGHATTNGTQFTSLLDRVLLPANDPHRLSDPSEIARLAGAGENVPLTNTGAHVLQQIAAARGTPAGEADAMALRKFFAAQYPVINPLENKANGTSWHQQEIAYQNFVNSTLKNIDFQKQADPGKSLTELLKPGGDIWNSVLAYKPTNTMISEARQKRNQFKVNQKTGQPEPQGITQDPALLNKATMLWQQQAQQARVAQIFEKLPTDATTLNTSLNQIYNAPENKAIQPLIKAEILRRGWAYQRPTQ